MPGFTRLAQIEIAGWMFLGAFQNCSRAGPKPKGGFAAAAILVAHKLGSKGVIYNNIKTHTTWSRD